MVSTPVLREWDTGVHYIVWLFTENGTQVFITWSVWLFTENGIQVFITGSLHLFIENGTQNHYMISAAVHRVW